MRKSPHLVRNEQLIAELCAHPVHGKRFRKYEAIARRMSSTN